MGYILNKYQFIKKQFAKTNKKNDENYVVSRIWHLVNNVDVKMITQQYIVRDVTTKKYALADIYFPQFNMIVEVDEPYHLSAEMLILDKVRQHDIIQATECDVFRIAVTDNIDDMNRRIDELVQIIHNKVNAESFKAWNIKMEYNPQTYIERGYLDANEHIAFKTVSDCCNCFGAGYKGFQRSGAKHKFQKNIDIKGLKFYPNGQWNNRLELDEMYFTEFNVDEEINRIYLEKRVHELRSELALFAHVKSDLGGFEYVFKGWYRLNAEETKNTGKVSYKRISKIMSTYYPLEEIAPNILARAYDQGKEIARFYKEEVVEVFRKKYDEYQIVFGEFPD